MMSSIRLLRMAVLASGLASLAVILVPRYMEPLWNWAKFTSSALGNDPLPSFGETQHVSSLVLAGFVLVGVAYNYWRDRRYRALQAEYAYQTGATHLQAKVADLEAQLRKTGLERDKWQEAYLTLSKQHTDALVKSKEHEDGFREAMHLYLKTISDHENIPEIAVATVSNGSPKEKREKRPALPFA